MVTNEAFCLTIGRGLGIPVAETAIMEFPEPILVVTRYDRVKTADGRIQRVYQEDLTKALSINSSAKYEDHQGPGLRRFARLLRDVTQGSDRLEQLLAITVLNMVVGNADAHAKNHSLLHPEPGRVELAPAYDITSTTYYPRADVRPGMFVNGKTSIHEITTQDIIEEASTWGLGASRAAARVTSVLRKLSAAIEAAARDVPSAPPDLIAHVKGRAERFVSAIPDAR